MKKIIWAVIGCMLFFIALLAYLYLWVWDTKDDTSISTQKTSQKTYKHTFPEQVVKNDFFTGEFIRNDIASIYPRRASLVKDILVDIGDEVYAGQTLAILFEPWVEGQSSSNISYKSTIVDSHSKILSDTKKVSDAKIAEFEQEIQEKETLLQETLKNYDAKIAQVWDSEESRGSEYTLALQSLTTLENSLKNAEENKEQLLSDAKRNIEQKLTVLNIKIEDIYSQIIPIIYIWEENDVDYTEIQKWDLHYLFSAKDSSVLGSLITEVQMYQWWELDNIEEKYESIKSIISLTKLALKNTVHSAWDTPQSTIDAYITIINSLEIEWESIYEWYIDAQSAYKLTLSSQQEKIERLKDDVQKQKENIAFISQKYTTLESDKSLETQKLTSELETLRKSKELLIASESRQVTKAQNDLAVAKSDLNKEYVASWDYKIISPFSGTISKRDIEIGEMISEGIEVFRVSWVDNTLSRITKKEIKFYVPESLQWKIQIWQEVYFSSHDSGKTFSWTIYRISPEIDEATRSITLQAKVNEGINLSNKSTLRVSFETESFHYKVPTSTIYNKWERTILYYKKDNGKLWVKDIVIVSDDGEFSLITGDFDETLKVVTTPIFVK